MDPELQAAVNEAGRHLQDAADGLQKLARVTGSVLARTALTLVQEALADLQKIDDDDAGTQAGK